MGVGWIVSRGPVSFFCQPLSVYSKNWQQAAANRFRLANRTAIWSSVLAWRHSMQYLAYF